MMRKLLWIVLTLCAFSILAWWLAFAPAPGELQNRRWALKMTGKPGSTPIPWDGPGEYYMEIAPDGKVKGRAGCQQFTGQLYAIRFTNRLWAPGGDDFRTQIHCSLAVFGWIARENAFIGNISASSYYMMQGHELQLYFDGFRQYMLFAEVAP